MTEPTDAELWQVLLQMPGIFKDPVDFARAVLAKFGTPPAGAGEPVAGGAVAEVVMAIRPPKASPAWLPHKIIHASLQWLDSVPVGTKLYATQPAQAADSALEDAARLEQIAEAIRDYHHALDMRKHGGLAESVAFNSICQTMGMPWNQGEEAARRAARKQGGVNGW